ncbi:hypothetical protein EIA20_26285, partial [Escherichia coli]
MTVLLPARNQSSRDAGGWLALQRSQQAALRSARQPIQKYDDQAGAGMADGAGVSRALILGASVFSFAAALPQSGLAQTSDASAARPATER